jgi:ABC-type uncharacterized transport system substrate-binding protein
LIIDLAEKPRLPTIWPATEGVRNRRLHVLGIDWQDVGRRIAGATDQILKGKNPNDIPIQQPTAALNATSFRVRAQEKAKRVKPTYTFRWSRSRVS